MILDIKPAPVNEGEHWQIVDYIGGVIFEVAKGIEVGDPCVTRYLVEHSQVAALSDWKDTYQYWVNFCIKEYNLVPESECPPGLRENIDDTSIPPAPDGKTYWWKWYNKWKKRFEPRDCEFDYISLKWYNKWKKQFNRFSSG